MDTHPQVTTAVDDGLALALPTPSSITEGAPESRGGRAVAEINPAGCWQWVGVGKYYLLNSDAGEEGMRVEHWIGDRTKETTLIQ